MVLIQLTGSESIEALRYARDGYKAQRLAATPGSIAFANYSETISAIDNAILDQLAKVD